jgi:hypothetical protein
MIIHDVFPTDCIKYRKYYIWAMKQMINIAFPFYWIADILSISN